ncbi:LysR family transcriptional regulator [Nocardia sp. NPDC046763]|uniref:LysR family transcriptional regulator n=1 Tax=Nocardia sp. NPDC046763 TaxID=3155256 RepID=UPI0033E2CFBA
MLFRQLEYFVALARERHFARAAAACYVSQPALSEAIRKLENELKVPLVKRGRTFEGLTPEGERLVLWARRILADHDALKQEVTALRTGLSGELRLGVIPASAATIALLTDPFCAAHPLVRIHVETSLASSDIVDRLRRFELDAGVIYPDGQDTSGLTVTPLYREEQVLLVGADLVAERTSPLDWIDIVELPLCLLNPGMRGRQLVDTALAARNLVAHPRLETDSVATLFAHVSTGRWATVIPSTWLRTTPPPAGARVVPLRDPAADSMIALVIQSAEPVSTLARALIETARAARPDAVVHEPTDRRPTKGGPEAR